MRAVTADHIRVFLHVLGASVWLGGQIVLGAVVPVLRGQADPALTRAVARRFQQIAWPAFALLLATGLWHLHRLRVTVWTDEQLTTLLVKLGAVAVSGVAAGAHAFLTGPAVARATDEATARRRRALSGATAGLALLGALGAAFWGVQL